MFVMDDLVVELWEDCDVFGEGWCVFCGSCVYVDV